MKMSTTQKKSILVSILTAGSEVILFGIASALMVGPILLALRWMLGATGAVANFTLNRRWAFETDEQTNTAAQGLRFAVTALCGVSMSTALWWAVVQQTGWDPRVVHLVTMISVWFVFTYPMFKLWVFRCERSEEAVVA